MNRPCFRSGKGHIFEGNEQVSEQLYSIYVYIYMYINIYIYIYVYYHRTIYSGSSSGSSAARRSRPWRAAGQAGQGAAVATLLLPLYVVI